MQYLAAALFDIMYMGEVVIQFAVEDRAFPRLQKPNGYADFKRLLIRIATTLPDFASEENLATRERFARLAIPRMYRSTKWWSSVTSPSISRAYRASRRMIILIVRNITCFTSNRFTYMLF